MKYQVSASARTHAAAATLYDRLGGIYPIALAVDDFIDRLVANETLNANPAVRKARNPAAKAGLKFLVTAFVAQAAGGPQIYTGRSMKDVHSRLNITEREWQAMAAELRAVLYRLNIPDAEIGELEALVETAKSDIVAPFGR